MVEPPFLKNPLWYKEYKERRRDGQTEKKIPGVV
jgi:hypothetical protein